MHLALMRYPFRLLIDIVSTPGREDKGWPIWLTVLFMVWQLKFTVSELPRKYGNIT